MMNILNKICIALTVIFVLSLLILVAEILYVLHRRRRFHNRNVSTADVESTSETSSFYPSTPSKELLYFFCWKNQTTSRIEPRAASEAEASTSPAAAAGLTTSYSDQDAAADVDEVLKRHAMYGPSRVLYTIREEEREEIEMDLSSVEREENIKKRNKRKKKKKINTVRSVSLEEIPITVDSLVVDVVDDTTPFSTPCVSPSYFTPSPSPPRERSLAQFDAGRSS